MFNKGINKMKKFLFLAIVLFAFNTSLSQFWFQASLEHKFNDIAGMSISNEVGYNFMLSDKFAISPSLDYTYFSDGMRTNTLLFECASLSYFPLGVTYDIYPYLSVTGANLETYPERNNSLGYSIQVGFNVAMTSRTVSFGQYRYFKYTDLLQGQLAQFGIMYTFGG